MIESAAYDVIKQEGLSEGLQQGLSEGLQQGLLQGKIQEAQEAILDYLEARFEIVPESVTKEVQGIEALGVLKTLRRGSVKVASLDEFKALLKKAKA